MDDSTKDKQEALDRRYIRMASIWAENSYCQRLSNASCLSFVESSIIFMFYRCGVNPMTLVVVPFLK